MLKNLPLLVAMSLAGTASLFAVEVGVGVGGGGVGVGVGVGGVGVGVHAGTHHDGYRYHGGHVVQYRAGVEVPVTTEVTLDNGARVLPDGYIVYRDGRRERFVEDRWIGTNGEWVSENDVTPVDNFEGYYWEDDHLYVVRAGVPTIVTTEVVLDNGTRILPSGEYITREGARARFSAGVEIDIHGHVAQGTHHHAANRSATDVSAHNQATRQPNTTTTNPAAVPNTNTAPGAVNTNPATRQAEVNTNRENREATRDTNQANRQAEVNANRENREAARDGTTTRQEARELNRDNRQANRDTNQANREATRDTNQANREAGRTNNVAPSTTAPQTTTPEKK